MAKRLIDAEALDKVIEFYQAGYSPVESRGNAFMYKALSAVRKMVADAPTVDAVVPVHAEWIDSFGYLSCPMCKRSYNKWDDDGDIQELNYCPGCGAKLDGEKETEAK